MSRTFQLLLSKAFPVVALSGLFLAAWILVVEPSFTTVVPENETAAVQSIQPRVPSVYAELGVH